MNTNRSSLMVFAGFLMGAVLVAASIVIPSHAAKRKASRATVYMLLKDLNLDTSNDNLLLLTRIRKRKDTLAIYTGFIGGYPKCASYCTASPCTGVGNTATEANAPDGGRFLVDDADPSTGHSYAAMFALALHAGNGKAARFSRNSYMKISNNGSDLMPGGKITGITRFQRVTGGVTDAGICAEEVPVGSSTQTWTFYKYQGTV